MNNLEQSIRQFVIGNYLYGQPLEFSDADSLVERGIIDSTGVLELVTHLESEYNIAVEDDELVPENLDSIERVANYVRRKTAHVKGASSVGA